MTIRKFPGQASDIQGPLPPRQFPRLPRGLASPSGIDHLRHQRFGVLRVFVEIRPKEFTKLLLNGRFHLTGDQLILGL